MKDDALEHRGSNLKLGCKLSCRRRVLSTLTCRLKCIEEPPKMLERRHRRRYENLVLRVFAMKVLYSGREATPELEKVLPD